ncbi:hypothetical protein NQ317_013479 [Molorchus minor]|uniref:Uncharacterized protein n=1 Tax=Molorchus minor TaxID=1323400 RepID=A0ABQ9JHL5_9CUCU|nr:hypothetical protein NQ317_013479 [Molorchus minor]
MDNNRANQLNPNNNAYWKSRGYSERPSSWFDTFMDIIGLVTAISSWSQSDRDNRSRQLNPNHDTFWSSRGQTRP